MMNPANGTAAAKELVSTEIKENIGTATINDPHKANCLSSGVLHGLLQAFDAFEPQNVRVVIIRAYSGAKIWSAGHDSERFIPTAPILSLMMTPLSGCCAGLSSSRCR